MVLAILLAIALVIRIACSTYQNRRLKSLKENPEVKSKKRKDTKDIFENPAKPDGNYEQVENQQWTYTTLKKAWGER